MDQLDFLGRPPHPSATLTIYLPNGESSAVEGLSVQKISEKCPLLAMCFERTPSGIYRHEMHAASRSLVISFLRFLYTGDYIVWQQQGGPIPCSLLTHAELCYMGDFWEVPELLVHAHTHIIRVTELACYFPQPPKDLCKAIQYIYDRLDEQKALIDTILHYCVNCFSYHNLNSDPEFRELSYKLTAFHKDLCRTNFHRDFVDDGAVDIVRLPVSLEPETPKQIAAREAMAEFMQDLFVSEYPKKTPADPSPTTAILTTRPKPAAPEAVLPVQELQDRIRKAHTVEPMPFAERSGGYSKIYTDATQSLEVDPLRSPHVQVMAWTILEDEDPKFGEDTVVLPLRPREEEPEGKDDLADNWEDLGAEAAESSESEWSVLSATAEMDEN